jgi:hypothetical protein
VSCSNGAFSPARGESLPKSQRSPDELVAAVRYHKREANRHRRRAREAAAALARLREQLAPAGIEITTHNGVGGIDHGRNPQGKK